MRRCSPRTAIGCWRGGRQGISGTGGGVGAGEGVDFGRALHRGRHAARSVGQREEFSAPRQAGFASTGRCGKSMVNFHDEKRSNQTHESKTDPDVLLARKGAGKEAKLSYSRNLLVGNRSGLIVSSLAWEATGTAESLAAMAMLQQIPGAGRVTVGSDKGFDTAKFVYGSAGTRV
jgi:hypothetical protein